MISSGVDDQCKLAPWCPSCPPDFFSLFFRRLFVLCVKRSEEGGRLLLWLSFACRSCNDFTCWVKLPICSCICCIRTSCCSSAVSSCWILSSRCPNWSRRDVFSSRRCIRSSSIVIPVLYWVCRRLTSPADLSCYFNCIILVKNSTTFFRTVFFGRAFYILSIEPVEQTRKENTSSFVCPAEGFVGNITS